MSVTYGFYNSLNGDRKYNAEQMSTLFNGIINDGVFANIGTALVVEASTGNTVKVGIGRAWFNGTWTQNDAILLIEAEESEILLDRIDAVIIEVNKHEDVRENTIKIIKGTPSSSPINPTLEDSEYVHQHVLAYIYRTAESTEIKASDITNMVGTDSTPFITGILEVISQDVLLGKWRGELDDFVEAKGNELEAFKTTEEAAFLTWWANLQTVLDGDVAANLTRVVNDIGDKGYYSRNLLNPTLKTTTSNGITCTDNGDGTYTLNGTATNDATFKIGDYSFVSGKTYRLVGCPSGGNYNSGYSIFGYNSTTILGIAVIDAGSGKTFTPTISASDALYIKVIAGVKVSNLIFKPMLVDATVYPNATYNNFQQYVPSNADISDSVLDSLSEITIATEEGLIAGALAVKELNSKITEATLANDTSKSLRELIALNINDDTLPAHSIRTYSFNTSSGWFSVDFARSSDSYTGVALPLSSSGSDKAYRVYGKVSEGADSVLPFSSGIESATRVKTESGAGSYTASAEGIYVAVCIATRCTDNVNVRVGTNVSTTGTQLLKYQDSWVDNGYKDIGTTHTTMLFAKLNVGQTISYSYSVSPQTARCHIYKLA